MSKGAAYGLSRPTATTARDALARVLGADRADAVFQSACDELGIARTELSVEELAKIARVLAARSGIESVLGVSLQIRCETFLALVGP